MLASTRCQLFVFLSLLEQLFALARLRNTAEILFQVLGYTVGRLVILTVAAAGRFGPLVKVKFLPCRPCRLHSFKQRLSTALVWRAVSFTLWTRVVLVVRLFYWGFVTR